jgi:hypothetical protein
VDTDIVSWQATEDMDDGHDLVEHSGTVAFQSGQNEAYLELKIRGDTEPELDEIATVRLTQVAYVSVKHIVDFVEHLSQLSKGCSRCCEKNKIAVTDEWTNECNMCCLCCFRVLLEIL